MRIVNWGELLASKGCEIIAATYLPFEVCTKVLIWISQMTLTGLLLEQQPISKDIAT